MEINNIIIRRAIIDDLQMAVCIYEDTKRVFEEEKTYQWSGNYPNKETFEKDIKENSIYTCEVENKVVGLITIVYDIDPNYQVIDGRWLNNEKYASIHRICVLEKYRKNGIGKKLFEKALEEIKSKNIKNIRIDTYYKNESMLKLIEKYKFIYCGNITLLRNDYYDRRRLAFQKIL